MIRYNCHLRCALTTVYTASSLPQGVTPSILGQSTSRLSVELPLALSLGVAGEFVLVCCATNRKPPTLSISSHDLQLPRGVVCCVLKRSCWCWHASVLLCSSLCSSALRTCLIQVLLSPSLLIAPRAAAAQTGGGVSSWRQVEQTSKTLAEGKEYLPQWDYQIRHHHGDARESAAFDAQNFTHPTRGPTAARFLDP